MQAVEPTPGLVYSLTDEIGGKALLEHSLILKGIMPLGYWHSSRIKPAISYLRNAPHRVATLGTGKGNRIHIGAMQIQGRGQAAET